MKMWVLGLVAVLLVPQLAWAGIGYDGSGRVYPVGSRQAFTETDGKVIGLTTLAAVVLYNTNAAFLAAAAVPVGIVYGAWRVEQHRSDQAKAAIRVNLAARCEDAHAAGTAQSWLANTGC